MSREIAEIYDRVARGCGIVDLSDHALLWSAGRDRIDLLHRMSTNDLTQMAANEGRATVLTNALARMVDRLIVINLAPGERALLLGGAGTAEKVRRWLAGYIFFRDEVAVTDASADLRRSDLFGPTAPAVAEKLVPGASALKPYHVLRNGNVIVGRGDAVGGGSFFVLAPPAEFDRRWKEAAAAGAVEAGREVFEVMRVEAGLPSAGREISEEYIPLEAGLWNSVSFSKGCYIGQEIIARMESRGRLAKQLVGLRVAGPVAAGTEFQDGNVASGVVTTVVQSPRLGWIGLAFVKPAQIEAGTTIKIGGTEATISTLPFAA